MCKQITVIHFVHTLFGGVANVAGNIMKHQHDLGYKTVVAYVQYDKSMESQIDFDYEKIQVPMKNYPGESMLFGMKIRKIYNDYVKAHPEEKVIVHAHNIQAVGSFSNVKNIPLICTLHGFNGTTKSFRKTISDLLYRKTIRKLLKHKKTITAVSNAIIQAKELDKVKNRNLIVPIHNSSDMDGITRIEHDEFTIGHVGDLSYAKGWDTTFKAYCLLPKTYQDKICFRSVGHEHQFNKEWIRQECQKRNLDNRVFYDGYSNCAKKEFLPKLDLLIISSRDEGFPVVQVEAMSIGIPVLARNVGGICECLKDGYNGFVIKDEKDLCEKIIKVYQDKALYNILSQQAILTYDNSFTAQIIMAKYDEIYAKII